MKRKILIVLLAIASAICCAFAVFILGGCNNTDDNRTDIPILKGTEGLAYEFDFNTDSYVCTGIGSATETDIVIASKVDGKAVTSIDDFAFYYCTSLTSVTIGSGITSIGWGAFLGCTSLKGVYITDLAAWCKIEFHGYDGYANPLYYAHKLYLNKNLLTDITADMLQGVTTIGGSAFADCTSLKSVTIPDSVTTIGENAFDGCTSLATVHWNATNCSEAGSKGYPIFSDCTALKAVHIGENVEKIPSYAFSHCTPLESITIPDSVTTIGSGAFQDCDSLTSIEIPNSVTEIGDSAFLYCTSLESIEIPNSVTEIGDSAFLYCTSLESIEIPDSVTTIGSEAFYHCTKLTSVTIGSGVTTIGDSAFLGCTSLESIEIPDSVTTIGEYAFDDCTSLTSVTIGSGVTSIGKRAFRGCTSLKGVYITDLAAWCNIKFGSIYTSNPLYYAHKLYLNKNLVTDITADMLQDVTTIGEGAFYNCTSLESVEIPDSVTEIGYWAFYGCTSLKGVYITDLVAWCEIEFGSNPLSYAHKLYLNNNLVTNITADMLQGVTSIGYEAFYGCTSLESIEIPDSVTSIGSYAFSDCDSLTSVKIGNGVTSIGRSAFEHCTSLEIVRFANTTGWKISKGGMFYSQSAPDLSNPTQNAKYLKSTYYDYYWKRE